MKKLSFIWWTIQNGVNQYLNLHTEFKFKMCINDISNDDEIYLKKTVSLFHVGNFQKAEVTDWIYLCGSLIKV